MVDLADVQVHPTAWVDPANPKAHTKVVRVIEVIGVIKIIEVICVVRVSKNRNIQISRNRYTQTYPYSPLHAQTIFPLTHSSSLQKSYEV